jgi:uncharacterized repeat protein (TIGR03847 family)
MAGTLYELNPVSHITTGFVGQPGKRVFYLQATRGLQVVTLIVEKAQVQALADYIQEFVKELQEKTPSLAPAVSNYKAERMSLKLPLDPAFRVGQLGLGYDESRDLMVIVAQAIVPEEGQAEEADTARFFATRTQLLALSEHSQAIVKQGRPICGMCGQPIDPEGHFCPRSNGHRW